jgi:acyl carrier protein
MNLEERIKATMSSILMVPIESLNENSSKDNVDGWDSLKHMNLLLALEEEFKVTIPDEDAANITSFKLIKLIISDQINQA